MNSPHVIYDTKEVVIKVVRIPVYLYDGKLQEYRVSIYNRHDVNLGSFTYDNFEGTNRYSTLNGDTRLFNTIFDRDYAMPLQEQIINTYFDM